MITLTKVISLVMQINKSVLSTFTLFALVVLLFLGITHLALLIKNRIQERLCNSNLNVVACDVYSQVKDEIPETNSNTEALEYERRDRWGNTILIDWQKVNSDNSVRIFVRSAGRDAKYHTKDDIVVVRHFGGSGSHLRH